MPETPTPLPVDADRVMPDVVQRFGKRMRRARESRGWSLAQLAQILGGDVSKQYLALVEAGQRDVSLSLVARLTVALGMGEAELEAVLWGQKRRVDRPVAA